MWNTHTHTQIHMHTYTHTHTQSLLSVGKGLERPIRAADA